MSRLGHSPNIVLGDALLEAGCDSQALLAHLEDKALVIERHVDSGPYGYGPRDVTWEEKWVDAPCVHARGCWAVDLVLGKE